MIDFRSTRSLDPGGTHIWNFPNESLFFFRILVALFDTSNASRENSISLGIFPL